jgi:hypothetical protein
VVRAGRRPPRSGTRIRPLFERLFLSRDPYDRYDVLGYDDIKGDEGLGAEEGA